MSKKKLGTGTSSLNIAILSDTNIKNDNALFTLAHEIGHLITNDFHFGTDYSKPPGATQAQISHNLMKQGTSLGADSINSSKRIYQSQYDNASGSALK